MRTGLLPRVVLPLAVAIALAMAGTEVAMAHGGPRVATIEAGPYVVEVFLLTSDRGEGTLEVDVTLFLRDRRTLRPVDEAQVEVTYRVDGRTLGTFPAESFGNQYDVIVVGPKADQWDMELAIAGPSGAGAGSGALPLRSSSPWASLSAWLLLMFLVAVLFLSLFRKYSKGWR